MVRKHEATGICLREVTGLDKGPNTQGRWNRIPAECRLRNQALCHFNGYITGIQFRDGDVKKPLHTAENFYNHSGKKTRNQWKQLDQFLDEHFKPEFDWRKQCDWEENFVNTDRSYLTISLGFVVSVSIPYAKFKSLDKRDADIPRVSELLWKTAKALKGLIR